ncbi:MAG: ABC transporter permease, partial [Bacteroidia bacterium]|nr:ABC transporter permease [Bacteroidia bacterium]
MVRNWWKALAIILIFYSIVAGFLGQVPDQVIIYQSIRNLYFHVPMWFSMMAILLVGMIYSIKYLASGNPLHDHKASESVHVGFLLGSLGLLTGMIWARFTWGAFWVSADPQLNGAAAT